MQSLAQTSFRVSLNPISISILIALLLSSTSAKSQLNNPRDVAKSTGTNRGNNKMDQGINTGFDKVEKGIGGLFKKKKKKEETNEPALPDQPSQSNPSEPKTAETAPVKTSSSPKASLVSYGKFDFVPGEKIIFEDPVEGESLGEFPSKWDLGNGKIEIAEVEGKQVIAFIEGNYATIFPNWKDKSDYLPEVFTIEYDLLASESGGTSLMIDLRPTAAGAPYEDGDGFGGWITTGAQGSVAQASGMAPDADDYKGRWHHISLSVNKGNVKIYSDQNRLCNLPRLHGNPYSVLFGTGASPDSPLYIKNIRIAAGGSDLYKRIVSEGKIISRGILFDVDKATLKPQSMGPINEIATLMKAHPELKFEIGGHTDGDGTEARNLKLSQERADAVKAQLISMGLDASRFTTKGYGKTKPTMPETTPEAKANNRRVEFVKL